MSIWLCDAENTDGISVQRGIWQILDEYVTLWTSVCKYKSTKNAIKSINQHLEHIS